MVNESPQLPGSRCVSGLVFAVAFLVNYFWGALKVGGFLGAKTIVLETDLGPMPFEIPIAPFLLVGLNFLLWVIAILLSTRTRDGMVLGILGVPIIMVAALILSIGTRQAFGTAAALLVCVLPVFGGLVLWLAWRAWPR